jgi:catechol 2,3-dioxygenase-like lactoylglutathione lyase family enzyme
MARKNSVIKSKFISHGTLGSTDLEATRKFYEEFLGPSEFSNHGERVIVGQRLMQTASDIFLGHMRVDNHDYYVRQFRDMKVIPSGKQISGYLPQFAAACGHALAKSHARSGDPEAIAGYIGKGAAFADGVIRYARAYAEQTCADHADLRTAIANKEVKAAERGW